MSCFKYLSLSLTVCFLAACAATESKNVTTEGIYAVYTVTEVGQRTQAQATFYVGDGKSSKNGTLLELSKGDSVEVNGEVLSYNKDIVGKIQYQKSMPLQRSYTFVFRRKVADGPDEKYEAIVELPVQVAITSPKNFNNFRRGLPLQVRWRSAGQGDSMNLIISGSGRSADGDGSEQTFTRGSYGLADNGAHVFSGNDTNPDNIRGKVNNTEILVQRIRAGVMDRNLDGEISAMSQSRISNMTLTP